MRSAGAIAKVPEQPRVRAAARRREPPLRPAPRASATALSAVQLSFRAQQAPCHPPQPQQQHTAIAARANYAPARRGGLPRAPPFAAEIETLICSAVTMDALLLGSFGAAQLSVAVGAALAAKLSQ